MSYRLCMKPGSDRSTSRRVTPDEAPTTQVVAIQPNYAGWNIAASAEDALCNWQM
jgi:hypothetical protein